MQDAPFLVLRMLLIFKYGVLSYTNMFFTCKNAAWVTYLERNQERSCIRSRVCADSDLSYRWRSKLPLTGHP